MRRARPTFGKMWQRTLTMHAVLWAGPLAVYWYACSLGPVYQSILDHVVGVVR